MMLTCYINSGLALLFLYSYISTYILPWWKRIAVLVLGWQWALKSEDLVQKTFHLTIQKCYVSIRFFLGLVRYSLNMRILTYPQIHLPTNSRSNNATSLFHWLKNSLVLAPWGPLTLNGSFKVLTTVFLFESNIDYQCNNVFESCWNIATDHDCGP